MLELQQLRDLAVTVAEKGCDEPVYLSDSKQFAAAGEVLGDNFTVGDLVVLIDRVIRAEHYCDKIVKAHLKCNLARTSIDDVSA
jgi:hypothetical protein